MREHGSFSDQEFQSSTHHEQNAVGGRFDVTEGPKRMLRETLDKARRLVTGRNTIAEFASRLEPWQREDIDQYSELSIQRMLAKAEAEATAEGRIFSRASAEATIRKQAEFSKSGVSWIDRWERAQGGRKEAVIALYNEMVDSKQFGDFEKTVYIAYAQKTILVSLRRAIEDEFLTGTGSGDSMLETTTSYGGDYKFFSNTELAMDPELVKYVVDQNNKLYGLQRLFETHADKKLSFDAPNKPGYPSNDIANGNFGFVNLFSIEDVSARFQHRSGVRMTEMLARRGRGYDRFGMVSGKRTFIVEPIDLMYEDYDPNSSNQRESHLMREAAFRFLVSMQDVGDISWDDQRSYVIFEREKLIDSLAYQINDPDKLRTVIESPGFDSFREKVIDNGSVSTATIPAGKTLDQFIAELYVQKMFRFRTSFWASPDLTAANYPLIARRRTSQAGGWIAPDDFFQHVDYPSVKEDDPSKIVQLKDGTRVAVYNTTRGGLLKRIQLHPVDASGKIGLAPDYSLFAHFTHEDFVALARDEKLPNPPEVIAKLKAMAALNRAIDSHAKRAYLPAERILKMFTEGEGAAVYSNNAERNLAMARLVRGIEADEYGIYNSTRDEEGLIPQLITLIHKGSFMGELGLYIYAAIGRPPETWHETPLTWNEVSHGRYLITKAWPYDDWFYSHDPEGWCNGLLPTTYSLPEGQEPFSGGVVMEMVLGTLFDEFGSGEVTIEQYLQFYGLKMEMEWDEDAGVFLRRAKRIEDSDPRALNELMRDVNRGLPKNVADFIRSIHNVDIGSVIALRNGTGSGGFAKDNRALRTDLNKGPTEILEYWLKYIYGPTAYGGGVLRDFQLKANARGTLTPNSPELLVISAGRTPDRDKSYRFGEIKPLLGIFMHKFGAMYDTGLELAPPRDAKLLTSLGAETITINGSVEYLLPAVQPDFKDPYLEEHGIDRVGVISLWSLERRRVSRGEALRSEDMARGSMDFLTVPGGLAANVICRPPIQLTTSYLHTELGNPALYQGTFSYQEALVIRDACINLGIPYSYWKQDELMSNNPALRKEVDNLWQEGSRYRDVYNPLDWTRFFMTHKDLPAKILSPDQVADLADLLGVWVRLSKIEGLDRMMPVELQVAYFYEAFLRLGLKDAEWTKFAEELFRETKDSATEAVDFMVTGFGGNLIPTAATRALTKLVGGTDASIIGPIIRTAAKYGATGAASLGLGAVTFAPAANVAGELAIAGLILGAGAGVVKEMLNRFQGLERVGRGVAKLESGRATLWQHGPVDVLHAFDAFKAGIAVYDAGGDRITKLAIPGNRENMLAYSQALFLKVRGDLLKQSS